MAGKKQAPAKFEEEPEDVDAWEESVEEADAEPAAPAVRLRDWRDVERYREMKELRQLVDDDLALDEIFDSPIRPAPMPKPVRETTQPSKAVRPGRPHRPSRARTAGRKKAARRAGHRKRTRR